MLTDDQVKEMMEKAERIYQDACERLEWAKELSNTKHHKENKK